MSKVMIVEDDDSLREIYAIRLTAEGYAVVSARDGEEALAVAVKERPDLIISDVMMPKISGFDMLDILRSTPETQNIKVIMMTALSSEDQRVRGENLGADRYIVKSQVGIEDVVNVVHEVLGDRDPNSGTIDTVAPVEVPPVQIENVQVPVTGTPVVNAQPAIAPAGERPIVARANNQPVVGMQPAAPAVSAPQPMIDMQAVPQQAMPPAGGVTSAPQPAVNESPAMPPQPELPPLEPVEQSSPVPPQIMPSA